MLTPVPLTSEEKIKQQWQRFAFTLDRNEKPFPQEDLDFFLMIFTLDELIFIIDKESITACTYIHEIQHNSSRLFALCLAAERGHFGIFKDLFESLNARWVFLFPNDIIPAAYFAIEQGHLAFIQSFTDTFKDLPINSYEALLKHAATHGQLAIVQYLIETKQVSPVENDFDSSYRPHCAALYPAAQGGHHETVAYLLANRAVKESLTDHPKAREFILARAKLIRIFTSEPFDYQKKLSAMLYTVHQLISNDVRQEYIDCSFNLIQIAIRDQLLDLLIGQPAPTEMKQGKPVEFLYDKNHTEIKLLKHSTIHLSETGQISFVYTKKSGIYHRCYASRGKDAGDERLSLEDEMDFLAKTLGLCLSQNGPDSLTFDEDSSAKLMNIGLHCNAKFVNGLVSACQKVLFDKTALPLELQVLMGVKHAALCGYEVDANSMLLALNDYQGKLGPAPGYQLNLPSVVCYLLGLSIATGLLAIVLASSPTVAASLGLVNLIPLLMTDIMLIIVSIVSLIVGVTGLAQAASVAHGSDYPEIATDLMLTRR